MNINSEINNNPILIGVEDACRLTGIGRNTMLDIVKMEGCPSIKFGKKKIYINKKQFIEWINSLTSTF